MPFSSVIKVLSIDRRIIFILLILANLVQSSNVGVMETAKEKRSSSHMVLPRASNEELKKILVEELQNFNLSLYRYSKDGVHETSEILLLGLERHSNDSSDKTTLICHDNQQLLLQQVYAHTGCSSNGFLTYEHVGAVPVNEIAYLENEAVIRYANKTKIPPFNATGKATKITNFGTCTNILGVKCDERCVRIVNLTAGVPVIIYSPGYPFTISTNCNWLIRGSRGHTIEIRTIDFRIPSQRDPTARKINTAKYSCFGLETYLQVLDVKRCCSYRTTKTALVNLVNNAVPMNLTETAAVTAFCWHDEVVPKVYHSVHHTVVLRLVTSQKMRLPEDLNTTLPDYGFAFEIEEDEIKERKTRWHIAGFMGIACVVLFLGAVTIPVYFKEWKKRKNSLVNN